MNQVNIYAVRDRLLEWFDQPFQALNDGAVKGAISTALITGENIGWQTSPQTFELWGLGSIDEEGNVKAQKRLIATLDSFVRPGVRRNPAGLTGDPTGETLTGRSQSPASGYRLRPGPDNRPPATAPHTAPVEAQGARQEP